MILPVDVQRLERLERRLATLEQVYATVITDAVNHVQAMRVSYDTLTVELERRIHALDRFLEKED